MKDQILITGSSGLIGCALRESLETRGISMRGLDVRGVGSDLGDVRDANAVRGAIHGCAGVIHLAAISRVVWGERDPDLCWATNVGGLKNVLDAALQEEHRPWVIFASSREVYGQPDHLPADEDAPLRPVNVYARSKVEGERLVESARALGLRASIVRLSNVFGSVDDHADRVVPAFARAAAFGHRLRVDGAAHTFDFTHVSDVTNGIVAMADSFRKGVSALPPIHLVTGRPTTLGELARLAITLAGSDSDVEDSPPRSFDVARFYGSSARARAVLDWEPSISLEEGLSELIHSFRTGQRPVQVN